MWGKKKKKSKKVSRVKIVFKKKSCLSLFWWWVSLETYPDVWSLFRINLSSKVATSKWNKYRIWLNLLQIHARLTSFDKIKSKRVGTVAVSQSAKAWPAFLISKWSLCVKGTEPSRLFRMKSGLVFLSNSCSHIWIILWLWLVPVYTLWQGS